MVITHQSFSKRWVGGYQFVSCNLRLKQDKQENSGRVSSSHRLVYCRLIRVIVLCVFRVREDGTKYKKTRNPRQFTNGRKKEKDSRALSLKQVGNKDAMK